MRGLFFLALVLLVPFSNPALAQLIGYGQYNSTLPTMTNGASGPVQTDSNGRLLTNCATGCGSGGGGIADESTFTQGTTSFNPIGGFYNSSVTNLTSGQGGAAQLTNDRMLFVNIGKIGGNAVTTSMPVSQATAANLNATVIQSSGANLHVDCDSGCSSSSSPSFGATFPSTGTPIGGEYFTSFPTYSTNAQMQPITLSAHGEVNIACGDAPCMATDLGAFTSGTSTNSTIACLYQTTATSNSFTTTSTTGTPQCNKYRALMTAPTDSGGGDMTDSTAHALHVEGNVTGSGGATALQPEVCTSAPVHYNATATGDYVLVPASSGKTVHVCDFDFSMAGASTFYIEYGTTGSSTGGTCSGSLTQVGITWTGVANEAKAATKTVYTGLGAPSGDALCFHVSAVATGVDVGVYYDQ